VRVLKRHPLCDSFCELIFNDAEMSVPRLSHAVPCIIVWLCLTLEGSVRHLYKLLHMCFPLFLVLMEDN